MNLPTFLYIGPPKSGSTWLFEMLSAHPDCFVPGCKDIYFFDKNYHRGIEWYAAFFKGACGYRAVGDISHDYIYSPEAAERIRRRLPDVRLITILRNPFDLAVSQYLYLLRNHWTTLDFSGALDAFEFLTAGGMHAQHLGRYLDRFDRQRVGVFTFDELHADPRAFGFAIQRFLNIERMPDYDYHRVVKPASMPRLPALAKWLKQGAVATRRLGMARMVGRVKHNALINRVLYKKRQDPMAIEIRGDLKRLGKRFDPEIDRLERLIDRRLDHWKSDRYLSGG